MGFTLTSEKMEELITNNPKNKDVIFQYVNGEDLNSRPDQSPSRWVINFFDWPLARTANGVWVSASQDKRDDWLRSGIVPSDYPGKVASDYPEILSIVRQTVKPERDRVKRDIYRIRWWNYAERQKALYQGMASLSRVIATAQTSKYITVIPILTKILYFK